ncbi:hypothetical protein [Pseudonocardia sp. HH130630-07]|uniref:hypothetical protein n=1 Tax=Pseudonocardia sp. HH130630-07 TaxID=1690815 RepID=UPI001E574E47|nr:hypothetical protein [Pseudonocardia sp. HH130630-07]
MASTSVPSAPTTNFARSNGFASPYPASRSSRYPQARRQNIGMPSAMAFSCAVTSSGSSA